MCGIVGYTGPREAAPILMEGLRRLEYRGYDSAAIAHLVEEAYDGDIADAVRAALRQLEGAYALAVLHRDEPERIIGARKDVPLIVGVGEGENFLASDVSAILAHTNRVIFLHDGDVADVNPEGVRITDVAGQPMERTVE